MYFTEKEIDTMRNSGVLKNADIQILSQIKEPYLSFILAVLYKPIVDIPLKLKTKRIELKNNEPEKYQLLLKKNRESLRQRRIKNEIQ